MVPWPALVVAAVLGVLFGRWTKAMRALAQAHTAVHNRADASAVASNENRQVVVIASADGEHRRVYDLGDSEGEALGPAVARAAIEWGEDGEDFGVYGWDTPRVQGQGR